ncbi:hypothetical protein GIB67_016298 [Kingdonia uniflora]|uniref:Uncharacterized protein n=1 Tax=Kingdonia uniflora TaxID=39325 RepID=A0A7J7M9C5_9MAGN|nr:hypothetical protein GIB67_016298 [Kingdonia uniflora]
MSHQNSLQTVRIISRCAINSPRTLAEPNPQCYLTPWDIAMLSADYIQKGLLFTKSQDHPTATIIAHIKNSLSLALSHYPPLTRRLVTTVTADPKHYSVSLDKNNPAPGVEFVHAVADVITVGDVVSPEGVDTPEFVNSFFALNGAVNHDGHSIPLLVVQVTELVDGIFIALSLNHTLGDGTSFWHFFGTWSEISRAIINGNDSSGCVKRPPIMKRLWFPEGHMGSIINLPFSHSDQFIERYTPPPLRERIFHFTTESIAKLKAKANLESNTLKISSFQALSALVWRSITRARRLPFTDNTTCRLATDNRSRLSPSISKDYFGNCIHVVFGTATVGKLLENNLGWSALLLNRALAGHTDGKVREWLRLWMENPMVYRLGKLFDNKSVMMGSSPRFDMYGNDFGWGKAVAARSGYGNKFDGKVSSYPGSEGGGSVDLEICLPPLFMSALETDIEFMDVVSF